MRKFMVLLTFLTSSFFLFLGDVKAYELEYDVDLTLLDENFYTFKETMEQFIETDTTYSDKYIIFKSGSNLDMYAVVLPLDSTYQSKVNINETILQMYILGSGSLSRFVPSSDYTSYSISGTVSYRQNYIYHSNLIITFIPLYANYDILMSTTNSGSTVTYKYNDFTTVNTADGTDVFKTLYMINKEYEEYVGAADAVHKEELEKIGSFYTVIIDKIAYLSEVLISNYIYLSIIVIFILIFLFKLIFRRYL